MIHRALLQSKNGLTPHSGALIRGIEDREIPEGHETRSLSATSDGIVSFHCDF
jgi:hypothetical protein